MVNPMNRDEITQHHENGNSSLPGEQFIRVPPNYEVVIENGHSGEETHFSDYVRQLWRRRWLILVVFCACMGSAIYLAMKMPPTYRATALMKIGTKAPK